VPTPSGSGGGRRAELGLRGEAAARKHLEAQGFQILAQRFRCRFGEIDLVGDDGRTLVFVEVKTRSTAAFGKPEESVTARKQARLGQLATAFLVRAGLTDRHCRFDVVAVEEDSRGTLSVRHIPDAFRL